MAKQNTVDVTKNKTTVYMSPYVITQVNTCEQ